MTPFSPVRCVVVGLGMIGRHHAAVLAEASFSQLLACCDIDSAAVANAPTGVPVLADLSEALSLTGLEAVIVCTPQHTHREVVCEALARGLHVMCEKPIAASIADAEAMIASASQSRGSLVIGHTLRFDPNYLAVLAAASGGRLGRVLSLSARRCVPDFEGRVLGPRTSLPVEVGVHDLDVLRALAGEVASVYAEPSRTSVLGPDSVDALVGQLSFAGGALATVEFGWSTPAASHLASDYRLAVFGTKGCAFAEFRTPATTLYVDDQVELVHTGWLADVHGTLFGVLPAEDEYFCATVRGHRHWPVSLEDARDALLVALALDESASRERPVRIDDFRAELEVR